MNKHERYERYKSKGKCPNCGKDSDDGFVYCSSCRQEAEKKYMKNVYPDGTKKCVDCGNKISIKSKRTSIRCLSCQRKHNNEWARNYYATHPDKRAKVAAYYKERYRKNKEKSRKNERAARIMRLYGISDIEYDSILASQEGKCAICGSPIGNIKKAFIDHNHITNEIRGLLCPKCNFGLGNFNDDIEILTRAIAYLSPR